MITAAAIAGAIWAVTVLHLQSDSSSTDVSMREWWKLGSYINDGYVEDANQEERS